jgi:hypothetical protein
LKLTQVDLSDAEMIKTLLENLEILDELSGHYSKVNDLRIDLLRKVNEAGLDKNVLRLVFERLVNNKALRQVSSEMKVSPRWAKKTVDAACEKIASSGPPDAVGPWFSMNLDLHESMTAL